MTDYDKYPALDQLIAFHGHMCPGLAIGYRATMAALDQLGIDRSSDEELIAIVENDSCSVDAAQYLAGTTFGKGNLFFRDWGKQVFTFARRDSNQAIRVALKMGAMDKSAGTATAKTLSDAEARQQKIDLILDSPLDELFDVGESTIDLPPRAEIRHSLACDNCGEPVMETRMVERQGRRLCHDCAGD
jgi:formylmethanofuran dehydrogenase subunit E